MTRGTLHYGSGNVARVWVDDSGEGITASSGRPLSAIKFRAFADKYRTECLPQMKPASVASITSVLSTLCKSFGAERLSGIGTEEIQKFITGSPYSPKTLKNQIGVFRMVWTKARAWGYVKHNPFEFLSMPRQPLSEARALSAEEVRAILRKTSGDFHTMLWILAETGIRGGELVALYKSDVDSAARTMKIARSAFRKQIQTPKTVNAVREIAISGRLAQHLSIMPVQHNNLVFAMPDGRPWDGGEIVRRLKPVLGVGVGLHALRHMNASLMASIGVPEHLRRERLGHSSGNITARYTHSNPTDHRLWAEKIGNSLDINPFSVQTMAAGAD